MSLLVIILMEIFNRGNIVKYLQPDIMGIKGPEQFGAVVFDFSAFAFMQGYVMVRLRHR